MELEELEKDTDRYIRTASEILAMTNRDLVLDGISSECDNLKEGSNHAWVTWYMIFTKYVGELSKEILALAFNKKSEADDFYLSLIRTLAVGLAWAEEAIERIYGKQEQS